MYSAPELVLSKKHLLICYNFIRKGVASEAIRMGKIDTHENPADFFTKLLPITNRHYLLDKIANLAGKDQEGGTRVFEINDKTLNSAKDE